MQSSNQRVSANKPLVFTCWMPSCHPTNIIKALKGKTIKFHGLTHPDFNWSLPALYWPLKVLGYLGEPSVSSAHFMSAKTKNTTSKNRQGCFRFTMYVVLPVVFGYLFYRLFSILFMFCMCTVFATLCFCSIIRSSFGWVVKVTDLHWANRVPIRLVPIRVIDGDWKGIWPQLLLYASRSPTSAVLSESLSHGARDVKFGQMFYGIVLSYGRFCTNVKM